MSGSATQIGGGPLTQTATTIATTISAARQDLESARAAVVTAEHKLQTAIEAARADLVDAGKTMGLGTVSMVEREVQRLEGMAVSDVRFVESRAGISPSVAGMIGGVLIAVVIFAFGWAFVRLR